MIGVWERFLRGKRRDVRTVVGECCFVPGLCAVGAGVAKGGGEDVSGSEVSARSEEPRSRQCRRRTEPRRAQVQ